MRTPFGQTIRSYFSGGIGFGSEIAKAVSSGIMQGRNDLNFEQIFGQASLNLAVNNYIIPAVFESENIKISSAVVKEINLPTDATINNKRNFTTKKTLPIFLSAVIALNSFLFSCTQIKPRQTVSVYYAQEYTANKAYEKELLIAEIHKLARGDLRVNKKEINNKIIQLLRIDVYEGLKVSINIVNYIKDLFSSSYCKWRGDCSKAIYREIHDNKSVRRQLLEIIESMKLNRHESTHILLVALSNLYLPPKVIDTLALKLDYTDGIQGDDEDILLSILLMNYKSSFMRRLLKTKTQTIIDGALKQISYEVLSNLRDIFLLSRGEVGIIKTKINNQLQYYGYDESEVAMYSSFKIYKYERLGFSYLGYLEAVIAHEIGHNILQIWGIGSQDNIDSRIMHQMFAYTIQTAQYGYFPTLYFLGGYKEDSPYYQESNIPLYQLGYIQNYIDRNNKEKIWNNLAKVAFDEICKGKSFKEVVQAMFKEAGYNGDLKAVRIKRFKRDIYVPVGYEINPEEYSYNKLNVTVHPSSQLSSSSIDNTKQRYIYKNNQVSGLRKLAKIHGEFYMSIINIILNILFNYSISPQEFFEVIYKALRLDKQDVTTRKIKQLLAESYGYASWQELTDKLGIVVIGKTVSSGVRQDQSPEKIAGILRETGLLARERNSPGIESKGGVDFTVLPAVTQPVSSPLYNNGVERLDCPIKPRHFSRGMPSNDIGGNMGIDNKISVEWFQIEKMVSSGIVPSTDRIKRCLINFCCNNSFERQMDKIICYIALVLRLEEERVDFNNSPLRKILALIESNIPTQQMQFALAEF